MGVFKASELGGNTVIPFGVPELDEVTGVGGVPTKKITEVFGPWSIGKTTLGLYVVASAQRLGMDVLWSDTEFAWENPYASSLGVDTSSVDLLQESYAEAHLDGIVDWVQGVGEAHKGAHQHALVVLDSVGHLTSRDEVEKGAEGRVIGAQARLMAGFVRRMKILINTNDVALLILNHQYNPIEFGGAGPNARHPQVKASGGAKLEYAKDLSILLAKTYPKGEAENSIQKISRADGSKGGDFIKATIYKNKLAGTKEQSCIFPLSYGQGIHLEWNLTGKGLSKGVIVKEGNTYSFQGKKIAIGKAKMEEAFKDPELRELLRTALAS